MTGETGAALAGGKKSMDEALNLATTYFAPVAGLGVGFFLAGPKLGGAWGLADLLYGAVSKTGAGNANNSVSNATDLVAGAIFGSIFIGGGYALYRSGHHSGWVMKGITGFFGGFFAGWGAHQLLAGIGNATGKGSGLTNTGYFDQLVVKAGG